MLQIVTDDEKITHDNKPNLDKSFYLRHVPSKSDIYDKIFVNKDYHKYYEIKPILREESLKWFMHKHKSLSVNDVSFGYHGTRQHHIQSCLDHGILMPGQKIPGTETFVMHSTDYGYYGRGIYTSPDYNTACGYGAVFVCLILRGKSHRSPYAVGSCLKSGYDSHISPDATEWVLFDSHQVLPIYLVRPKGGYNIDLKFPKSII